MNVIRHDDEFVEEEFSFVPVVRKSIDQESAGCLPTKDGLALGSNGRDEEGATGVHFAIVDVMGRLVCERCHKWRSCVSEREGMDWKSGSLALRQDWPRNPWQGIESRHQ